MYFIYFIYTYYEFFFFFFFCIGISSLLFALCFFIANQNMYYEKVTGYECGFNPFSDARDPFNIKFFLIAILFIMFDIELLFFFPWCINLKLVSLKGFYIMYVFYIVLVFGYLYEWKKSCINLD